MIYDDELETGGKVGEKYEEEVKLRKILMFRRRKNVVMSNE